MTSTTKDPILRRASQAISMVPDVLGSSLRLRIEFVESELPTMLASEVGTCRSVHKAC